IQRAAAASRAELSAAIADANARLRAAGVPSVPAPKPAAPISAPAPDAAAAIIPLAPFTQAPGPSPSTLAPTVTGHRAPLELGSDAIERVTWKVISFGSILIVAAWLGSGFVLDVTHALPRALPAMALTAIGVVIARHVVAMRQPGAAWVEWDDHGITEHDAEGVRARIAWTDATCSFETLYRRVKFARRRFATVPAGRVLQIRGLERGTITVWTGRHAGAPTWLLRRKSHIGSHDLGALHEATRHLPTAPGIVKDDEGRRRLDGAVGALVTSLAYAILAMATVGPYFGAMPVGMARVLDAIRAAPTAAMLAAIALLASLPALELVMISLDRARRAGPARRALQRAVALEIGALLALAVALSSDADMRLLLGRW
ncbi:MAG: hypothetical protein M3Y87_07065, partial [Myxococcota bacterium]|nr:hypothetical protein [Myxococcota bacterium]